ncbi:Ig-like domain-containing protein [Nitrosospira sp. Nsp1]|uniref:Ig-like domain-containing protein n=1 Tax=Nitrosospira sp. Nsp1 TaxID=136547 RepID=UPI0008813808|nr:Ig-like domain-containing protein [Nitrosospira sp. Nsp1]SCX42366.1 Uncharacterized conserved protein [Nitrosospira sp. Nsp1]
MAKKAEKERVRPGELGQRKKNRVSRLLDHLLDGVTRERTCCDTDMQFTPLHKTLLFEALEPRLLLSADLIGSVDDSSLDRDFLVAESASISVRITNQGDAPATPLTVRLFASQDSQPDIGDTLIGTVTNSSSALLPGTSTNFTVPISVDELSAPGHYKVITSVDPDQQVPEGSETNNVSVANGTLNVAWRFGEVPGHAAPASLSLTDSNGTTVIFSLTGPGWGEVSRSGEGLALSLFSTDATSVLAATATGAHSLLTGLTVDGNIKSILAPSLDLQGNARVAGSVQSITLGDVKGSSSLLIQGGGPATAFSAGNVHSLVLTSATPLSTVTVKEWLAFDSAPASINASSLGTLIVTGVFSADVNLSGAPATSYTLGSAQIGGALDGGSWIVLGRASQVAAQSTATSWKAAFSGPLSLFSTRGDASGQLSTPSLQALQVGGNLNQARVIVGANLGSDGALGGTGSTGDQFSAGVISRFRVTGSMVESHVWVGVDPRNGIFNDGNDTLTGSTPGKIQELLIGGSLDTLSHIVAGAFPNLVKVGGLAVTPSSLPQLNTSTIDITKPSVSGSLSNDAGHLADDRVTSDSAVRGQVTDAGGIASLKAGFDAAPASEYTDILSNIKPDGNLELTAAQLAAINGAVLVDGTHTLHFIAADKAGNSQSFDLQFTLDTSAPNSPNVRLAPGDDSGTASDDNITNIAAPRINVSAEAETAIRLYMSALLVAGVRSGPETQYQLGKLTDGAYTLNATAEDLAGNVSIASSALQLTIDTVAPSIPTLGLAAQSDTGALGDNTTTNETVVLTGATSPGARVDLVEAALNTVADSQGAFSFNGVTIALGDNDFTVRATDVAGNSSAFSQTITRTEIPSGGDTVLPQLNAALATDTGSSATDGITSNASIVGTVSDNVAVTSLLAGFDATPSGQYKEILSSVQADGTLALSPAQLAVINSAALADGTHTLHLIAADKAGNSQSFDLQFTLDTSAPNSPSVRLAAGDDSGSAADDNITNIAAPRIDVSAESEVAIRLYMNAILVNGIRSGPETQYQLDTLADGAYSLSAMAEDLAGNVSNASPALQLTIDTTAPSIPTLGLASQSDTGTLGDNTTTNETVVLTGTTSPGARIDLVEAPLYTVADTQGAFAFSGVPLALGNNNFTVRAADVAGNSSEFSQTITRAEIPNGGDTILPQLNAALASDTGSSTTDGITSNASISGTASDNVAIASLLAGFDATPAAQYREIVSYIANNGEFVLDLARLESIFGGTLTDGSHTLHLQAFDAAGNASAQINVAFTLDTATPAQPAFDLAITSDSGTVGDHITNAANVTLVGSSDPGASISVVGTSISALANNLGNFQLAGIVLRDGANVLTLRATDAAGNTSDRSITFQRTGEVTQDQALFWNHQALEAIRLDVTDPPIATRLLAMVSLAIYDSLAAIDGTQAYLVKRTVEGSVSADAAVASAAHRVLSSEYPGQKGIFDAALADSLTKVAEGSEKDAGIALGTAVADIILALRSNDGSDAFVDYPGSGELGKWRPTGPMFEVADQPNWANVMPFALTSPDEFRSAPPPALDSAAYAQSVEEIRSVGSATSTTRTADQTQQAQFWADGTGSYTPPGHWNQIAEQIAQTQGNSLSANARLFAMLNVGLADAAIACWDAKYTYGLWRPETAINNADLDNNAATVKQAGWTPLLITPSHPEYASGHSTFSAAAARILGHVFGTDTSFSTTAYTLPGVTRSFDNFDAAAEEAGRSRVYGGIHYEFTNQAGKELGHQVADAVLARFALNEDTQAPAVVVPDTPAAVKTNLTLSGQILDNLSGVASSQYRIDGGELTDLALDADGKFTISTAFGVDGSADGSHTVTILARDAAGNLAAGFNRSFTLDTQAPVLDLTSLADGATLSASSRVAGTANPTGTQLVELFYTVDSGQKHRLSFDATTGSFDQSLILRNLGIGDHSLVLNARDAAGNSASLTREVKIEALSPFTVTRVTPVAGSGDVGVTYRPQVFFSREVNPNTLTADTFYATGPDGAKLDTTIVPALDGSFAWLFFDKPMPGGSNITLHLDGSAIRAQADGSFLDGDGNGTAGGELTWSFTSVSSTIVANTRLVGKVVDPGADLLPMTFDDIRRGLDGIIHTPDDVFLNPIAHAKVYIIGLEDKVVYTDANGNFELTEVPVGEVKIAVDGRTATNAPDGIFFPEMVMSAQLLPGVTNTVMGSMGSNEERLANAERREVYLPRVQTSSLQQVSQTETTVVTVDAKSAPDLTDEQRSQLTLTVPPGSAVGFDGKPVEDVKIGINTVPPELVRDMLPPGVLQHSFDITIQAPGVNTFNKPVQITFPNVFNADPGTKLNILSFDHTTGMLVINGTGTVSADGKTVISDEGSGIMAPGWHGITLPSFILAIKGTFQSVRDVISNGFNDTAIAALDPLSKETYSTDADSGTYATKGGGLRGANIKEASANRDAIYAAVDNSKNGIAIVGADKYWNIGPSLTGAFSFGLGVDGSQAGFDHAAVAYRDEFGNMVIAELNPNHANDHPLFGSPSPAPRSLDDFVRAYDSVTAISVNSLSESQQQEFIRIVSNFEGETYSFYTSGPSAGQVCSSSILEALFQARGDAPPELSIGGIQIFSPGDLIVLMQEVNRRGNVEKPAPDGINLRVLAEEVQQRSGRAQSSVTITEMKINRQLHYRIDIVDAAGFPQSFFGKTDNNGSIEISLPQNRSAFLWILDPLSMGFIGHSIQGAASGLTFVQSYVMDPGIIPVPTDTDGDGVPNFAEYIVRTSQNSSDTDSDGISDRVEIEQGLDPLGGLGIPSGIVSATSFQGAAEAVMVAGSTSDASRLIAYVATGTAGLAVVDVSQFTKPTVLAELDLSGTNNDVAVDSTRGLAVLAANEGGLHIVDVSNSTSPVLRQTLAFPDPVTSVEVRDGLAYVATGSDIAIVDLNTGDIRQTLDLGNSSGATLTGLALEGSTLYTMDASRTLRSITIDGDFLTLRDSLVLAAGGGKLFVGGSVAYVGTTTNFTQGYSTVDVANAADLKLLSGIDAANIAGQSLAATGSGLLVTAGNLRGPRGEQIYALDVSSSNDPANTGSFITRISLPDAPKDVVLANGLAFVADGTSGLQIVNYIGFDTKGVAPTVSIKVDGVVVDPEKAGIQILEGRTVNVIPTVTDDVQVRNVELLVNGKVVSNDAAFPFELFAQAPTIAQGGNKLTIQVRATDTGGNSTLSDAVVLDVVPDTFAPQVTKMSLDEGARVFFVRSVDVSFDEPLDLSKLNLTGIELINIGLDGVAGTADDKAIDVRLDTRSFGQSISVLPNGYLLPGAYQLRIDPSVVADSAGNALAAPIVRNFSIRPASDIRAGSGVPEITQAPSANPGQEIGLPVPFDPASARTTFNVIDANGNKTTRDVAASRFDTVLGVAYFNVPLDAITGEIQVFSQVGNTKTIFADGTFLLQILPVITDVQVQSVAADGSSATVLISGLGFVESNNSEYRFGSDVVLDAGVNTGADVQFRYDPSIGFIPNGYVQVTVPLSGSAFGPISIKTAGGASASYSVNLSGIGATALSGTPADADEASANPGQAITLQGAGLSTATDVLLRWTDISGNARMTQLNPTSAAANGSSATLLIPEYANGVASLQVFGSASQPLLQIVPRLTGFDVQNAALSLYGSGFVEGASSYNFIGATVADSQINGSADVYYNNDFSAQNGRAYLDTNTLPRHGLGGVTVTTAGGTSAALDLNLLRPGDTAAVGALGDVAVDPSSGALWVSDNNNPGHILRIDAASGAILQTITLNNDFGTPYVFNVAGLQVLGQAMSLNGTSVPAGTLVLFNGYPNPDRVIAVNPANGAVIASLALAQNYDLTAGVFDAASGHLFVTDGRSAGNRIAEINPATGAEIASFAVPFNISNWAGLAIDPVTGNLWLGSYSGSATLVELTRTGTEVRRLDLASQGVNNSEISGLAFAPDGSLRVASTNGVVYRIDPARDAPVQRATLTQVIATATDGVAAQSGVAAANVGQIIELRGSNFGSGTQVLFNTRDNNGNTSVIAVRPLAVDAAGTRLQVLVPDLAATGDIKVVNAGASNLGFTGYNDSIYRKVTATFTANGATAVLRFADGGLQDINDESWGIDNVVVKQGSTTVFADTFEGGAKANWSNQATDRNGLGTFSEFSGRFGNASQVLNLSGLTAGQTYTLNFDLYVLDSWEGSHPTAGPDLIQITADGQQIFRETFANYYPNAQSVQTYGASDGIRLQVVPTLTGLSGRPGSDSAFSLIGSGFMEGASTLTIGGRAFNGAAVNGLDVSGARNDTLGVIAPRTLDGPLRVTTEGGYAQIAGAAFGAQPTVLYTGLASLTNGGIVADATKASANTGQVITLTGQAFTSQTLVQFTGIDDSGALGTITRTGTPGSGGTSLSIEVPALARTGKVTVLGSNASFDLQIVPTLKSLGGSVVAGNTVMLEGTGLVGSELIVQVDGRATGSFNVRTVFEGIGSSSADQQLLTLTVPNGVTAGVITVSTSGGSAVLRSQPSNITTSTSVSPGEAGDTLATVAALAVPVDQRLVVNGTVGDGTQAAKDVDFYRVDLAAGTVLSLVMDGSSNYTHVRVFDAAGNQLVAGSFNPSGTPALRTAITAAGSYYVGVSGHGNSSYNPGTAGSGTASSYTGAYKLTLEHQGAGTHHLGGISATAGSGIPASNGIASANTGQTITLQGIGLQSGDRLLFTTIDSSGRLAERTVIPVSVAADGSSLTVVVPTDATTGTVRLARDSSGVLLQIVPTLSDISASLNSLYNGGSLTLSGSGFAEGATSVLFGNQRLNDSSRNTGPDAGNTTLSLTVPTGAPTGPIQVVTIGGTSAAFGLSITGITASASSGTAANAAQASAVAGQTIKLQGTGLDASTDVVFETVDNNGNRSQLIARPATVNAGGTEIQVAVPLNAITGTVRVVGDRNASALALQILPVITDVQVQSVAADGSSATVLISGLGFVESNNSEYRFGSDVVLDAGVNTGADVQFRYDPSIGFIPNGYVQVTVPLSGSAFGPISIKTAGGASASYSVNLSGIGATALSGTPADADEASANPGQAITLQGAGLSTATDVLLRWTDISGNARMTQLNPTSAAANGSSATLLIPEYANGVASLQVFGSASQPLLQIVPRLTGFDVQNAALSLYGSGFVEGASSYNFIGATVADSQINGSADVYYNNDFSAQNGRAYLDTNTLPRHGLGGVTVTTAGGTSAALDLNLLRPGDTAAVGALGDVAVDPSSGALWVSDNNNPGHILRIDAASGAILQTITLNNDFGTPYVFNVAGLQVLGQAMSLNGTSVPAGTLVLFNGYPNPDRVIAVNPANGAVIASLALAQNYDLTAGVFDAASGHLFVTDGRSAGNRIAEINPATGAEIASFAVPFNISNWAGLAIDPVTGNLWLGSYSGSATLVELTRTGTEVRRLDLASQGVNNSEISGLAFAPDGSLRVASTNGVVYRIVGI